MRATARASVRLDAALALTKHAAAQAFRVVNGSALFIVGALALIVDDITRRRSHG